MSEKEELPVDIKNDLQLAFNLYKNTTDSSSSLFGNKYLSTISWSLLHVSLSSFSIWDFTSFISLTV